MVYLGATLGLRIGRSSRSRYRPSTFEHQTVTVTESVGEAGVNYERPKTALRGASSPYHHRLSRSAERHRALRPTRPDGHLFTPPGGGPLRPNTSRQGLGGQRASEPDSTASGSTTSALLEQRSSWRRRSVRDAQQILGHADPSSCSASTPAPKPHAHGPASAAIHFIPARVQASTADDGTVRRLRRRHRERQRTPPSRGSTRLNAAKARQPRPQPVDSGSTRASWGGGAGNRTPASTVRLLRSAN